MKTPNDDAVEALLDATPVLVGIATRALEPLDDGVSLPQFRLLRVLAEAGPVPSSAAATRLGALGSSVTRLADRLEASGHLTRRRDGANRSVVTLELTDGGRALVDRVLARRRAELVAVVEGLPDGAAARVAEAMRAFCAAARPLEGAGPEEVLVR